MDERNPSALSGPQAAFRFAIELAALAAWGIVGAGVTDGVARWFLAVALPVVAAIVWGTFRVPNDQSASGRAPVPVPGVVRLFIELDVLLGAAVLAAVVWRPAVGATLALAVIAHYAMTMERVRWLLGDGESDLSRR